MPAGAENLALPFKGGARLAEDRDAASLVSYTTRGVTNSQQKAKAAGTSPTVPFTGSGFRVERGIGGGSG